MWSLYDRVPQEDEHDKLDTLAEKLRGPMADQGQKLKQQVRGIIVPTIQQVKEVHETLENEGSPPPWLHVCSEPISCGC